MVRRLLLVVLDITFHFGGDVIEKKGRVMITKIMLLDGEGGGNADLPNRKIPLFDVKLWVKQISIHQLG